MLHKISNQQRTPRHRLVKETLFTQTSAPQMDLRIALPNTPLDISSIHGSRWSTQSRQILGTIYTPQLSNYFTFDHRTLRTLLPVCSALDKQRTGGLVVRWETTGESPLLNVFEFLFQTPLIFIISGRDACVDEAQMSTERTHQWRANIDGQFMPTEQGIDDAYFSSDLTITALYRALLSREQVLNSR